MNKFKLPDNIKRGFLSEIRRYGFRKVVAGVSGGADSTALLALLLEGGIETEAAHCNFHLRGEESMRDQQCVENLCSRFGVPLRIIDFDVEKYILDHPGQSLEMACRTLRYEWFDTLTEECGAQRVAVAHNADDNIETLFLNMLRGCGTTGLKGMIADTGRIWRPLLKIHRLDLEKFLNLNNITYITDSSNLKSEFRRNFLRNEVIPLIKSRWEGFDKAMDTTLAYLAKENEIIENAVAGSLPPEGAPLETGTILSFPAPELLIRRFISQLRPFTTTPAEIHAAILAAKPDVKRWRLRDGEVILKNKKLFLRN